MGIVTATITNANGNPLVGVSVVLQMNPLGGGLLSPTSTGGQGGVIDSQITDSNGMVTLDFHQTFGCFNGYQIIPVIQGNPYPQNITPNPITCSASAAHIVLPIQSVAPNVSSGSGPSPNVPTTPLAPTTATGTFNIEVTDERTNIQSTSVINAELFDNIVVAGILSPAPSGGCSACVNIVNAVNGTHLGNPIGVYSDGSVQWGVQIPQGTPSFAVQLVYIPTGLASNIVSVNLGSSTVPPITTPPTTTGAYTVFVETTDITSGQTSTSALTTTIGDQIEITGTVSPAPPSCSGCVNILVNGQSVGTVGLGSLGGGQFLYGPVGVPNASLTFSVQAVYTPTGASSSTMSVTVASSGVTVPPPTTTPPLTIPPTTTPTPSSSQLPLTEIAIGGLLGIGAIALLTRKKK